jgi:hypothetical protein
MNWERCRRLSEPIQFVVPRRADSLQHRFVRGTPGFDDHVGPLFVGDNGSESCGVERRLAG